MDTLTEIGFGLATVILVLMIGAISSPKRKPPKTAGGELAMILLGLIMIAALVVIAAHLK